MEFTNVPANPFKSVAERQIAQCLDDFSIPYQYEKGLLVYQRGQPRIWYVDYTLPKQGIYLEYFGRISDPEYARGVNEKLATYQENQLDVLAIYPFHLGQPHWQDHLRDRIGNVLETRLETFRKGARSPRVQPASYLETPAASTPQAHSGFFYAPTH